MPKQTATLANIDIRAKPGFFHSFTSDTWKMQGEDCFALNLRKGLFGSKWAPSVEIVFNNDDESNSFKLGLRAINEHSSNLSLGITTYDGSKRNSEVLAKDLKYGEEIRIKTSYPNDKSIQINSQNFFVVRTLNFTPTKLRFLSSSSVSNVRILDSSECVK